MALAPRPPGGPSAPPAPRRPDPPRSAPSRSASRSAPLRSERVADAVVHALGVSFALVGGGLLVWRALLEAPGGRAAAVAVYGLALAGTFVASAIYHMSPWDRIRPTLRRIDHAAIFLKIAGTFTPFAALLGGVFAYALLAVVWVVALAGAAAKVLVWHSPGRWSLALYLGLGWLGALMAWPLAAAMPGPALGLLVAGGALYTAGVAFFAWDSLRYQVAIWHAFVLAASGCMFAAVAMGTI